MNPTAVIVLLRFVIGLALSTVIGALACRRKSLSRSGVAGAVLTGTLVFGLGGLACGILLVIFFVTSSALSHYKASRKQAVVELFGKGGQRDLGQALANGGVAALCAAGSGIAMLNGAGPLAIQYWLAGLIGALAAANADTWATELGVLSRTQPRLITHPTRVVEAGTSGGITAVGTVAAAAGALIIGLAALILGQVAALLFGNQPAAWVFLYNAILPGLSPMAALLIASFAGGLTGAFVDSLLGATVQAMYYSERRRKPTEKIIERDGTSNRFLRGWVWMNNDWVNFLSSLTGACVSVLVFSVLAT